MPALHYFDSFLGGVGLNRNEGLIQALDLGLFFFEGVDVIQSGGFPPNLSQGKIEIEKKNL